MRTELEVRVEGMTCEHCARSVERALSALPEVETAAISYEAGGGRVLLRNRVELRRLEGAVAELGYRLRVVSQEEASSPPREADAALPGELLIIGGGSAAFAAAIRAAELGARVTIVEKGTIGGTCVNVGCVPSKTLIKAAQLYFERSHHGFRGIPAGDGPVDLAALIADKDELVGRLRREKYEDVLAAYDGVEYVTGTARFLDPHTVEIHGREGRRSIRAKRILIATGARPWVAPLPGLQNTPYWTHIEALRARELPRRLLVVGGSAVGVELAQMYRRLGSEVVLLEALPTLLPAEDPEVGELLAECLEEEGVEVHTGVRIDSVTYAPEPGFRLTASAGDAAIEVTGDRLLMATGRRANTAGLGLEAAGVEVDARGAVVVNEYLRTSQPHIYAAGDCAALPQFVYVAARAGTIAAEHALTEGGKKLDLSVLPRVTFTDPQVASVGLTEAKARERGWETETRTLPMAYVPRALANRDPRGLIKILVRGSDQRILGVTVVSPQAGEVIQTAALAIRCGLTVGDLAESFFPYLTEVEGLKLAAQTFTKDVKHLSCCAG
ncbi:MAG: mercury(II) reductase [Acidobacteriota bacterium]